MLRVLVISLVLLVSAMLLLPRPLPAPVRATVLTDPAPLPEVLLIDKTGEDFASAQLRGRFSLLFFGFTHCPDICPITLSVLANVHRDWEISRIDAPDVIFVSVDPARDDPPRINEYVENFHTDFQGLTGQGEALKPWLEALGVSVHIQKQPDGQSYNVVHNSTIYVVGPETELLAVFGAPHDATIIAADFLKIRQRYLSEHPSPADPSAS